ncbi:hypothetical protein [Blastococcus saxobsidens]|uniref:Uncharacterized protein n=1 Tax=Blastococcus saxobsidens (strain DD2) TaxID=1146883 RepID=H6RN97_BLASD|nr:hypothetical protein [Blastococcus saxobsidens]CCG02645.1 exported protein of unknown function; putative coiled-coil domain [Blastococcus saxobsidens DD2]
MSASAGGVARTGPRRAGRAAAAVLATAVGVGLLAACSDDPVGPRTGPAATEVRALEDRLGGVEDRLTTLEDRVGLLEDEPAADDEGAAGDEPEEELAGEDETGVLGDAEGLIGERVMVSGEVTEPVTVADVGASFRIAGDSGESVLVVMATPPAELATGDAVQVSGTVVRIAEDSFEIDFGIAADQLFGDPAAFFADFGGEVAISADGMDIVQDQAD